MGVYPGSTALLAPERDSALTGRCRFCRTDCANNNTREYVAGQSRHDFISGDENALRIFIEQAFALGVMSTSRRISYNRSVMSGFMYASPA